MAYVQGLADPYQKNLRFKMNRLDLLQNLDSIRPERLETLETFG